MNRWRPSWKADPEALPLADRHYNRRAVGSSQFGPPGELLAFVAARPARALWVSLRQRPEFVKHAWPGAWMCSTFRNEGAGLSSELIVEAVAATRGAWGDPPGGGMITFIDEVKTTKGRSRRSLPGACYRYAGWVEVGRTKGGHGRSSLVVLQLAPESFPEPFKVGQQGLF